MMIEVGASAPLLELAALASAAAGGTGFTGIPLRPGIVQSGVHAKRTYDAGCAVLAGLGLPA